MQVTFDKPSDKERKHLIIHERIHMTKIFVDGGAAANIMPYATYQKLGLGEEDLIQTDMMLKDFDGAVSPARGAIYVDLTIGSKTLPTTFLVSDWIHANCCIPSTMHQCVIQCYTLIHPSILLQLILKSGMV